MAIATILCIGCTEHSQSSASSASPPPKGGLPNAESPTAIDVSEMGRAPFAAADKTDSDPEAADTTGSEAPGNIETSNTPESKAPQVSQPDGVGAEATVTKPTADKPTADKPTADKPTIAEPATDEPTTDKPATDEPTTADKPAADNATTEPATDTPATDKPSSDKPATDKPTTDKPTTDKPTSDKPAAGSGDQKTPDPRRQGRLFRGGKDGDVIEISFEDINLGMAADVAFRPFMLSDRAKSLDGKKVRIKGFVMASDRTKGIKEFVLLRNTECKFGPGGKADHLMRVFMKKGQTAEYRSKPISIEGVLRVKPFPSPRQTWSVFDLEDAEKIVNATR